VALGFLVAREKFHLDKVCYQRCLLPSVQLEKLVHSIRPFIG
jgi:hypothetical protein